MMMAMSLSVLFLVGANAQPPQSTIEGDDNKIEFKVPGATLTLQATTPMTGGPNATSWNNTYIERGFLAEAVTLAVSNKIDGFATVNNMASAINDVKDQIDAAVEKCATKEELGTSLVGREIFLTSVVLPQCDQSSKKKACPSGDAHITAKFYGVGLLLGEPDLYRCILVFDEHEYSSNVSVSVMAGNPGRQIATCELPPAYHSSSVMFDASLTLREGGVLEVPSVSWNPLIAYDNDGPVIAPLGLSYFTVKGAASVLIDGNKLPVQLKYEDYYDSDTTTLTATFKSLSTDVGLPDQASSFELNKNTQVVNLVFEQNAMDAFTELSDPYSRQLIKFNMTLTDSHNQSTTRTLSLNITHQPPAWSTSGSSELLTPFARESILSRAGKNLSANFELCYDAMRDGWSTTKFHTNCDGKGALLMLLRRKNSGQFFGAYNYNGTSYDNGRCTYQNAGTVGDVAKPGDSGAGRGWLYRVLDSNPSKVEFAFQSRTTNAFYNCNRYHLTFGGGHDWNCGDTSCYCNIGSTYQTSTSTNPPNEWCTGVYRVSFNSANWQDTFDFYEVYAVGKVHFLDSIELDNKCDQTSEKASCPSGDAKITANFTGVGLTLWKPDMYTCVLEIDGKVATSKATVSAVQGNPGKQSAMCTLPAAYHPNNVKFNASLTLRENGNVTIPSPQWNPLIGYYNAAPTIEPLLNAISVKGTASVLEGGNTVPVQLEYEDYFDDTTKLAVTFKSLSTSNGLPDQSASFNLDVNTQIVKLIFDQNWMNTFVAKNDPLTYQEIQFNLTLKDSHNVETTKTLSFNLTHQPPAWSPSGNSDQLSQAARSAILIRAGQTVGSTFELCYDASTCLCRVSYFCERVSGVVDDILISTSVVHTHVH